MTGNDEWLGAGWVGRRTVVKTAVGFGVAILLVYLLGVAVGWGRTIERLRTTRLRWVAVACGSTLLCLVAWGKTWQVVLAATGVSVPYRRLVVTFLAATFANYVTPMGQAGGEPFSAYVLARDTAANYEQSLASVVTADVVRLVPFFSVGGVGLGYLLFESGLPGPIERFAALLVGLAVVFPIVVLSGWRYRTTAGDLIVRCLAPIADRSDRISIESIRRRVERLFASVELIADSPQTLGIALGLAYVGWILFALPLYFAGLALDLSVSLVLVCFIVPVTVIAGSTPLPGGLAAIEGTLVVLLSALAMVSTTEALAITTVYRLTSYWFVVGVGGVAAMWVIRRA